jgi:hypothetical protein
VILGAVKKSLLQSAPWILLALLVLAGGWRAARTASPDLLASSLTVFGMLGLFAAYGLRQDGWSLNQRYLLELVPLLAVALAVAAERAGPGTRPAAAGGFASLGLVLAITRLGPYETLRHRFLLDLPIALALLCVVAWAAACRRPAPAGASRAFSALLGACLGWALAVHLFDDLAASRGRRAATLRQTQAYAQDLPDAPAAVLAYWGAKDALAPLLLSRDLLVLDPWIDGGRDASRLAAELIARGRRVFVARASFPSDLLDRIATERALRAVPRGTSLVELTSAGVESAR